MKVLSLFSGVGGFDMGLENAGMETVFQCEWDKHANTILHKHWPDVPKWDDVSTLTGKHILANAPVVDVVAWGSPCQDLSVAGKRAGLEGGRSGLFHEGIRIIKELQEETNGQYPRISIWENVVGALNSNRGADFGVIIDEMAEAGALAIEWAVLDAQYFGVPQRRRRVFVIAIFDPVLAERSPSPLLPVAESLPGHLAKGKPKRQSVANPTAASFGTDGKWWDGRDTAEALTTTSNEQRMPDKQRFQAVVEQNVVGALAARDYKGVGNQYVAENKCVVEPMIAIGIQGNVIGRQDHNGQAGKGHTEDGDPMFTLTSTDIHAVAYPIDTRNALRDPDKYDAQNRQGLGIGADGDPMATLTSAHVNAVAFSHYDSQVTVGEVSPTLRSGTNGTGHAVAYDEYNDTTNEVHHALRAGTKQSTGVLMFQESEFGVKEYDTAGTLRAGRIPEHQMIGEVAATLRSGGDGGVPSSRGEHLVTEDITSPTLTAYNMDSRSPQSEEQQRIVNAVFESTMAVRRLTPLECERLMGWPDNHTLTKADGTTQADTHRYKQCGNGVASPVAQWIAKHLLNI